MFFIDKKSLKTYLLRIYAKPNSKKQEIVDDGKYLIVKLQSKAVQNKANKELISILKQKLNIASKNVKIISGTKGSNKIIQITFIKEVRKDQIIKKLLS
jgi:uncharacterized protein (TIGR00251 family)